MPKQLATKERQKKKNKTNAESIEKAQQGCGVLQGGLPPPPPYSQSCPSKTWRRNPESQTPVATKNKKKKTKRPQTYNKSRKKGKQSQKAGPTRVPPKKKKKIAAEKKIEKK